MADPRRDGRAIFDCIECFDNPVRRHSYNGRRSPVEYENINRRTDLIGHGVLHHDSVDRRRP